MTSITVGLDDALTVGTYKFTFKDIADVSNIPQLILPLDFHVLGKHIQITETKTDASGRFYLYLKVLENPIPIAFIVVGLLTVLGLGIGYMILEKVEKIIDSPIADIGIIAGSILLVFLVLKFWKRKL